MLRRTFLKIVGLTIAAPLTGTRAAKAGNKYGKSISHFWPRGKFKPADFTLENLKLNTYRYIRSKEWGKPLPKRDPNEAFYRYATTDPYFGRYYAGVIECVVNGKPAPTKIVHYAVTQRPEGVACCFGSPDWTERKPDGQ